MPFTLAHPALVMPLRNSKFNLSLSGLVMGSVVPDLEFFIQMREVDHIGHHWQGIFLFDLPVSIIFIFLFHNFLRNILIDNLSIIYKERFIALKDFNWNEYFLSNRIIVVLSVLIGVFSHLAWDSITHHDGLLVKLIPFLSSDIVLMQLNVPVFQILQVLFSILGMIIFHFQIMRITKKSIPLIVQIDYRYWISFCILFFLIISVRLICWPQFNSFGGILIGIMGGLLYSWVLVSIYFYFQIKLKTKTSC